MHAFVRNGDILGDLFLPDPDKDNGVGIVWCPGLPNTPITEDMSIPLSNAGFTVLQTRYPGSWQSYGKFGPISSIQGAIRGLELLSRGKTLDLATEMEVQWSTNRLILAGSSYGGGVAACAFGLTDLADAAVLFCPLLEPAKQNADITQPESDLNTLLPYLMRCHENVFREIDENEWSDFLSGRSPLNPPSYVDQLINRRMLLIHGKDDETIRYYHTERFYNTLHEASEDTQAQLILVEDIGHGKGLRSKTWDFWTNWMLS
ncbi:alpha/beta hydrolase family protein [Paenibacillus glycinis]|uniref:Prolyl oligopeptidase family serine peptidase n=1 Tax=Paenibacillus glycinis TaxID=2697035 RepID=A0ABW9Y068_9BACL|nr:prolyl oligopeptidase family serine peptidase [Paenibacillus glycinis]NBD28389.1 prolyl oligopeptidase family serine peptidase [Paenibacillus glycinis]